MGHKSHPIGLRLGIIKEWESRWFSQRDYRRLLHEDIDIRTILRKRLVDASVPRIDIERSANQVSATIHTAKPGIVIGKNGAKVEELRKLLEAKTGKRVRLNIQEIRVAELDAELVARSVAEQIERRIAFRRAIKQSAQRSMQRGAKGVRIVIAGRLGGSEMSRRERESAGSVPLHTLRADIDFGMAEAHTTFGVIGVKAWIYRGEVIPERRKGNRPPEPRPVIEPSDEADVEVPSEVEAAPVAIAEREAI
ncbi:MAG: 30S ribosomal protein S3 [Chloroflexota bacterium]|nr:MAG: 30S ribosomal protein S3 [Chloroflexota bacterium]